MQDVFIQLLWLQRLVSRFSFSSDTIMRGKKQEIAKEQEKLLIWVQGSEEVEISR